MERCPDKGPLAGVRVLDLSDEKASFCSKVLADLGALVLKVESPQGDSSRNIGPFWNNSAHPENSLFFWYHNSNKFGITLDLEQSADRKVLLRQVEHTDVLVETYPPGYLACLDLSFETLTQAQPSTHHGLGYRFWADWPAERLQVLRPCSLGTGWTDVRLRFPIIGTD